MSRFKFRRAQRTVVLASLTAVVLSGGAICLPGSPMPLETAYAASDTGGSPTAPVDEVRKPVVRPVAGDGQSETPSKEAPPTRPFVYPKGSVRGNALVDAALEHTGKSATASALPKESTSTGSLMAAVAAGGSSGTPVSPVIISMRPYSGTSTTTLTPQLSIVADDGNGDPLTYQYKVYNSANSLLADSGKINPGPFTVPAGKLVYGQEYYWTAQAFDATSASGVSAASYFSPLVSQPQVTSRIGGGPEAGPDGYDPMTGNWSMSAADANLVLPGGRLFEIDRNYNSLDPRTDNGFGPGWSSILDTKIVADGDGTGNIVVTMPNGQQFRWAKGATSSTFYAPPGSRDDLRKSAADSTYTLTVAGGRQLHFTASGRLDVITDPGGSTVTFSRNGSGQITKITSAPSGRSLTLTWTGTASTDHVATVATDAVAAHGGSSYIWNYTYTGALLTRVCPPDRVAPDCHTYAYEGNHSRYRTTVIDDNPYSYFGLDASFNGGQDDLAPQAISRQGGYDMWMPPSAPDSGTVAYSTSTPILSTCPVTLNQEITPCNRSETFNGTDTFLAPDQNLLNGAKAMAVELWFKTSASGVLVSADKVAPAAGAPTSFNPILYVGSDSKLRGEFWMGTASPITSSATVTDNAWHHVVLSYDGTKQSMYLDGAPTGTALTGTVNLSSSLPLWFVGTGYTASAWPASPKGTAGAWSYFKGSMDEVAFYAHALTSANVITHWGARTNVSLLTDAATATSHRRAFYAVYDQATALDGPDGYVSDFGVWYEPHDQVLGNKQYFVSLEKSPYDPKSRAFLPTDVPATFATRRTVYEYNPLGQLVAQSTDGTHWRTFTYNDMGYRSSDTDENKHTTSWTTDSDGNKTSTTKCRIATSCQTTYATYNDSSEVASTDPRLNTQLTATDARGSGPADPAYTTRYTYDALGRVSTVTTPPTPEFPQGTVSTNDYTAGTEAATGGGLVPAGLPKQITDARGKITKFSYNKAGDLTKVASPSGLVVDNVYDELGRPASSTTTSDVAPKVATTTFAYDGMGNLLTRTEPGVKNSVSKVTHTRQTENTYYNDGRLASSTDKDLTGGDAPRPLTISYSRAVYAANGESLQQITRTVTLPDGSKTTEVLRADGQVEKTTTTRGFVLINTYNEHDQPLVLSKDTGEVISARGYDPAWRLASTSDAAGAITYYYYFNDNLPSTTVLVGYTEQDGTKHNIVVADRSYDAAGNVIKSRESDDAQLVMRQYNASNQATQVQTDPQLNGYMMAVAERGGTLSQVAASSGPGWKVPNTRLTWSGIGSQAGNSPTASPAILALNGHSAFIATVGSDTAAYLQPITDGASGARISLGGSGLTGISLSDPIPGGVSAWGWVKSTSNLFRKDFTNIRPLQTIVQTGWSQVSTVAGQVTSAPSAVARYNGTTDIAVRYSDGTVRVANVGSGVTTAGFKTSLGTATTSVAPALVVTPSGREAAFMTASATGLVYYQVQKADGVWPGAWSAVPGTLKTSLPPAAAADPATNKVTLAVTDSSGAVQTRQLDLGTLTWDASWVGNDKTASSGPGIGGRSALNRTTSFSYNEVGQQVVTRVSAPDRSGVVTTREVRTEYNDAGAPVTTTVENGSTDIVRSVTRDRLGQPRTVTDPAGGTSTLAYDELGRTVTTATPSWAIENTGGTAVAGPSTETRGYDTFGDVTDVMNALGRTTTTTFDTLGRPLTVTPPSYTRPDTGGQVAAPITWGYDAAGNATSLTTALGKTTTTYDWLDRPLVTTGPTVDAADSLATVTTNTYNTAHLLSTTITGGKSTSFTYNVDGSLATTTSRDNVGGSATYFTTSYAHDGMGNVVRATNPAGLTSAAAFDAAGHQIVDTNTAGSMAVARYSVDDQPDWVRDRTGALTTFAEDAAGRPRGATTTSADGSLTTTTSQVLDANGNPQQVTDANGHTSTLTYDAVGHLISLKRPTSATASITTSTGYNALGQVTRTTDGRGNATIQRYNTWDLPEALVAPVTGAYSADADTTTKISYDAGQRPVTTVRPGGVKIVATFNDLGQPLTVAGTGAEGAASTRTFTYDAAARLATFTDGGPTTTLAYNERDLLVSATSTAGTAGSSSYTYGADGRLGSRTVGSATTGFTYDGYGRLSTVHDSVLADTTIAHDLDGSTSKVTYGSTARSFAYDGLGRVRSDALSTGTTTLGSISYSYDSNSNVVGKTTTGVSGASVNTYGIDWANRMTSWTSGSTTHNYTYDDSGNRKTADGVTFTFDARNEVTSTSAGATYTYTARGTRKSETVGGVTTQLVNDAFDETVSTKVGTAAPTVHDYDALGRLVGAGTTALTYGGLEPEPTAVGSTTMIRDIDGGLVAAHGGSANTYLWSDRHGDVVGAFTSGGTALTASASYSPWGTVTASAGTLPAGFQGQFLSPITGDTRMQSRWYDPTTASFVSADTMNDPDPGSNSHNFGAGNPITASDPTGHLATVNWVPSVEALEAIVGATAADTGGAATVAGASGTVAAGSLLAPVLGGAIIGVGLVLAGRSAIDAYNNHNRHPLMSTGHRNLAGVFEQRRYGQEFPYHSYGLNYSASCSNCQARGGSQFHLSPGMAPTDAMRRAVGAISDAVYDTKLQEQLAALNRELTRELNRLREDADRMHAEWARMDRENAAFERQMAVYAAEMKALAAADRAAVAHRAAEQSGRSGFGVMQVCATYESCSAAATASESTGASPGREMHQDVINPWEHWDKWTVEQRTEYLRTAGVRGGLTDLRIALLNPLSIRADARDSRLIAETEAKYGEIVASQSIRERGPVLTGAMHGPSGEVYFGQNTGIPSPIDSTLGGRIEGFVGPSAPGKGIPGAHSEINAVNEGMLAHPGSGPSDFTIYNLRLRGAQQGQPIRMCPNCREILPDVREIQ